MPRAFKFKTTEPGGKCSACSKEGHRLAVIEIRWAEDADPDAGPQDVKLCPQCVRDLRTALAACGSSFDSPGPIVPY